MEKKFFGIRISMIGGDKRELVLMEDLVKLGAEIFAVGYELAELPENCMKTNFETALINADVVILPMSGIDEGGKIKATFAKEPLLLELDGFKLLKRNVPVLIGVAGSYIKALEKEISLNIIETAELDEIAIYNSIPTAEGAIEIAIHEMSITLHASNSLILGFGRIGMTLARMLKGIGSEVSVVARKIPDLARISEQGYNSLTYDRLHEVISKFDVIFNTVPSLILTKELLELLDGNVLIIDLAARPGGTDFLAASKLGLKAVHALGLPGKTAPLTAGKILSEAYPKIILREIETAVIKGEGK